jgi:light-harvesting protein B-800-850 alpha chain
MFLAAVAIGSFLVHLAITTNTTWVKRFLNGEPVRAAAVADAPGAAPAAPAASKR